MGMDRFTVTPEEWAMEKLVAAEQFITYMGEVVGDGDGGGFPCVIREDWPGWWFAPDWQAILDDGLAAFTRDHPEYGSLDRMDFSVRAMYDDQDSWGAYTVGFAGWAGDYWFDDAWGEQSPRLYGTSLAFATGGCGDRFSMAVNGFYRDVNERWAGLPPVVGYFDAGLVDRGRQGWVDAVNVSAEVEEAVWLVDHPGQGLDDAPLGVGVRARVGDDGVIRLVDRGGAVVLLIRRWPDRLVRLGGRPEVGAYGADVANPGRGYQHA